MRAYDILVTKFSSRFSLHCQRAQTNLVISSSFIRLLLLLLTISHNTHAYISSIKLRALCSKLIHYHFNMNIFYGQCCKSHHTKVFPFLFYSLSFFLHLPYNLMLFNFFISAMQAHIVFPHKVMIHKTGN